MKGPLFSICMNSLRKTIKEYREQYPTASQSQIVDLVDGDFMIISFTTIEQEVDRVFNGE